MATSDAASCTRGGVKEWEELESKWWEEVRFQLLLLLCVIIL